MAERKQAMGYNSIMKDLKERRFAPIYLLMGEESFYIDRLADYMAEHILQPEERDFNQSVVFGSDITAAQLADMARRYPMMSEYQVIIVKEAQNIKNVDAIEKYLDNPVRSTILVLCHKNGIIDRRKKILAKIEVVGVVFESKKKRDYELPAFIEGYLKTKGVGIDNKSVQIIADHIGADLHRLTSELDKVILSLPESEKRITPDVVERQIGVSKDFNSFELRNAIVSKDIFKANQIVNYFDKNPKAGSLYSFLPLLFGFFQNLMTAYYAPNKNSEKELAAWLDLKSTWSLKDYLTGMRNYSGMKTMQIIDKFREVDAKSKGVDNPNTGAGDLMKELIFFILH